MAFDVDGTLISYQNETHIPPETIETVEKLKEKGHLVALATARSFLTAKPVMNRLGIHNAVLHNGAQIIFNDESIYENKIEEKLSRQICSILFQTSLCVFAFDGENVYVHNASDESKRYIIKETGKYDVIKQLCDNTKSLFSISLYGELNQISGFLNSIESIDFKKDQYEISAKNSSKSDGVKRLAKKMNIAEKDVIAVGDGINDIDMIRMAGTGIAVGNACPELKAAADLVTDAIDSGGIRNVFRQLNLI